MSCFIGLPRKRVYPGGGGHKPAVKIMADGRRYNNHNPLFRELRELTRELMQPPHYLSASETVDHIREKYGDRDTPTLCTVYKWRRAFREGKGEREPSDEKEEMKEEEEGSEPAEADPDEEMEPPAPENEGQQQQKEKEVEEEAGPTPPKVAKKSDKYCDKCEREMCSRQYFEAHMLKSHDIVLSSSRAMLELLEQFGEGRKAGLVYSCDLCFGGEMEFANINELKQHRLQEHAQRLARRSGGEGRKPRVVRRGKKKRLSLNLKPKRLPLARPPTKQHPLLRRDKSMPAGGLRRSNRTPKPTSAMIQSLLLANKDGNEANKDNEDGKDNVDQKEEMPGAEKLKMGGAPRKPKKGDDSLLQRVVEIIANEKAKSSSSSSPAPAPKVAASTSRRVTFKRRPRIMTKSAWKSLALSRNNAARLLEKEIEDVEKEDAKKILDGIGTSKDFEEPPAATNSSNQQQDAVLLPRGQQELPKLESLKSASSSSTTTTAFTGTIGGEEEDDDDQEPFVTILNDGSIEREEPELQQRQQHLNKNISKEVPMPIQHQQHQSTKQQRLFSPSALDAADSMLKLAFATSSQVKNPTPIPVNNQPPSKELAENAPEINQNDDKEEDAEQPMVEQQFDKFDEDKADNVETNEEQKEEEEQQKSVEMTENVDNLMESTKVNDQEEEKQQQQPVEVEERVEEDATAEMEPPAVEEAEPDNGPIVELPPPTTTSTIPTSTVDVVPPTTIIDATAAITTTTTNNIATTAVHELLASLPTMAMTTTVSAAPFPTISTHQLTASGTPTSTLFVPQDDATWFGHSVAAQIRLMTDPMKELAKLRIQQVIFDCNSNPISTLHRLATQLQLPKPQAPTQTTSIGIDTHGGINGGGFVGTTAAEKTSMDETEMVDVVTVEEGQHLQQQMGR